MTTLTSLLRNGWAHVVFWLVSRAAMVSLWRYKVSFIVGDVGYYFLGVEALPQKGIGAVMREYPTPVVWGLAALKWFAANYGQYVFVFGVAMMLLDAGFALALWRRGGPRRHLATAYWLLFIPLMGPLLLFRFDLLPAVLAGGGLLWLWRRPRLAGALVGLGAATKLWPALLIAPLAAPRKERSRTLTGFAAMGFGLALASLVLGGWDRLVSPLSYQKDRGLQIESVVATPLMWARTFLDHDAWRVGMSPFNAVEIWGPGTNLMLRLSNGLTMAGMLAIVWLCWRLFRMTTPHRDAIGLVTLAIVAIMIVTNKTLSPQYVVWLAGPMAVLIGQWDASAHDPRRRRELWLLGLGSCVIAGLTQLIYPMMYGDLMSLTSWSPWAVSILVARNVGFLVWTGFLIAVAAKATTRSTTSLDALPKQEVPR